MAGTGLLAGAIEHDPSGAFGEVTAAWIQALGSIIAIGAAVFIDLGSARRQRAQLEHADRARTVEKIEVVIAIASLASYAITWTKTTDQELQRPIIAGEPAVPWSVTYGKWAGVMEDWQEALRMLMQKVTDPVLLTDLVTFVHAMTPAPNEAGTDRRGVVSEAVRAMESSGRRLRATALAIAEAADVPMVLPALYVERD